VFVEVKTKTSGAFGEPSEAVHARKQQQLVWIATDYVARHGLEHTPCRFDVVSIESAFDPPLVTIIEDAFRPGW
jgi:putative endonuclease